MILDNQLNFSSAQALSATGASTNYVDLTADRNIGIGEPLVALVTIDTALAGTSPTFAFAIQMDDNTSFSSPTAVATSQTYSGAANVPAGARFVLPVPADTSGERYVRLNYTLGGTTPTVTVTAFLQPASMVQNDGTFADAQSIY